MAIEISKKTKVKAPRWTVVVVSIVLVLFVVLGGTYIYFYAASGEIKKSVKEIESKLNLTEAERALERMVVSKEQALNDFSYLISKHEKTSNVLGFFENSSHPFVWFKQFSYSSDKKSVNVSGEAADFIALGQQMMMLKEESWIKSLELSGISRAETGRVDFSLSIIINPDILKQ